MLQTRTYTKIQPVIRLCHNTSIRSHLLYQHVSTHMFFPYVLLYMLQQDQSVTHIIRYVKSWVLY